MGVARTAVRPALQSGLLTSVPTETQSLSLMRNLIRATVSTITYLRQMFSEEHFCDHSMCGINIKSLKPLEDADGQSKEVEMLVNWLENGVFDALGKKYLRTIVFGVFLDPDNENELLESFNFDISYPNPGEVKMHIGGYSVDTAYTREEVRKATMNLLRHLTIMSQTLEPLPRKRYLTVKLLYTDDTPEDYEPPYFRPAMEGSSFFFSTKPVKIRVGQVETQYHNLSLKVKTTVGLPAAGKGKYQVEEDTQMDSSDSEIEPEPCQPTFNAIKQAVVAEKICTLTDLTRRFPEVSPVVAKGHMRKLAVEGVLLETADAGFKLASKFLFDDEKAENEEYHRICIDLLNIDALDRARLQSLFRLSPAKTAFFYDRLIREGVLSQPNPKKMRARDVDGEKLLELLSHEHGAVSLNAKKAPKKKGGRPNKTGRNDRVAAPSPRSRTNLKKFFVQQRKSSVVQYNIRQQDK